MPLLLVYGSLTSNVSTSPGLSNVIDEGGHWSPDDCTARQRLAVVVPFRDRDAHLQTLVRHLHPFLQRQLVDYTIFVLEQVGFNPTLSFIGVAFDAPFFTNCCHSDSQDCTAAKIQFQGGRVRR